MIDSVELDTKLVQSVVLLYAARFIFFFFFFFLLLLPFRLEWPDGLYDVAWSEEHENQLLCVSGDGTAHLWDLGLPALGPVSLYKEHTKEIYRCPYGIDALDLLWNSYTPCLFSFCLPLI